MKEHTAEETPLLKTEESKPYTVDHTTIIPEKRGAGEYVKISYPIRYGRFAEIRTPDHIFGINRNGEVKTIQGRTGGWLQSAEWLKRTAGNDWAYFSAGGYNGAFNYTGEYYVPCLSYQSNAIFGKDRFDGEEVADAFSAWDKMQTKIAGMDIDTMPWPVRDLLRRVRTMTNDRLAERAEWFHRIIGGWVSVLPPDARHVEYDVIPLTISEGCLYNCGFCRVKSGRGFTRKSKEDILDQLYELKAYYNRDLVNYCSIFLGQHDALFSGADLIEFSAKKAYEILGIGNAVMKPPRLFLFGSVDSLLKADYALFDRLERLPFETFINIGLESGDSETLSQLKKPLTAEKVSAAFNRMIEINRDYNHIEVTANFVAGAGLPDNHLPSIVALTRDRVDRPLGKGAIYLSPLEDIGPKDRFLTQFNEFKTLCRLPAYIYLIQRL